MEKKLIDDALAGDALAFEEIYKQTNARAHSIALQIVKDEYEAYDVVQEAYITLFQKLNTLEHPEKLESWFAAIVRNGAIDFVRKNRPEVFADLESGQDEDFSVADTIPSEYAAFSPEEAVDYAETKRIMQELVDELPEKQKLCVLLRWKDDLKINQIAEKTGMPAATVKSCLRYGYDKLSQRIKDLEKQGVKLYGVAPFMLIPFLRWMFSGSTAPRAFVAGAAATGTTTGAVAGASAAGIAGAGITSKLIAGITAAALVVTGTVGVLHIHKNKKAEPTVTPPAVQLEESIPEQESQPELQPAESLPPEIQPEPSAPEETTPPAEEPAEPTPQEPATPDTPETPEQTQQPQQPQQSQQTQQPQQPQQSQQTQQPQQPQQSAPEDPSYPEPTVNNVVVLAQSQVTVPVGQSLQLECFYFGSGTLRYYSSHPRCLTVSETGVMHSIYEGNYHVYVTDGTYTADLNVFAPAGYGWASGALGFTVTEMTLEVGKSKLVKTTWDESGNAFYIYSENKDIATAYGSYITGVKPGVAIIRAKDSYSSAAMIVRVVESDTSGPILELTETEISMYAGYDHQFDWVYTGDGVLQWETSNMDVARIEEDGKIHTYGEGTAQIRVTDGVQAHACMVTVTIEPGVLVETLRVSKSNGLCVDGVTKYAGDTMKLKIDMRPYYATNELYYDSSDSSVVRIEVLDRDDHIFQLHFKKAGTATVTFTSGDGAKTISYTFHVKAGYDFDPGDGILTPEVFADYVNKILDANGVIVDNGVTGWLLGTHHPEWQGELTFDLAVSWGYGFYHTWWWNFLDSTPTEGIHLRFEYVGTNEDGLHQFKEYR